MLLSEKQFFEEELDDSIPAIAEAKALYMAGDEAGAERAFAEYFKASLDPDKYFSFASRELKFERIYADPKLSLIENADNVCKGKVRSCGYTYDFDGKIDWLYNGTPDGYREWVFQLNRHECLKNLAYAYDVTGDEKYAIAFASHIESWLEQAVCPGWPVPNRCSKYPMWRTISAGIRQSGAWPYFIHIFLRSASVSDRIWTRIAMSIWEHGEFLMNSPSSLNWLDIEMSGLNTVGTIYRFFKKSETWRTFAVNLMAEELKTQVYADGFQCELSSGYQAVVISTYLSIYDLTRLYGFDLPDGLAENIRRLFTMYPKIMRPDGRVPSTNDGFEARIEERMRYALRYFPADPEFTKILDGRIAEVYPKDVVMPYAGIITMRTGWGPEDVWMFFEAGPYGAGHQHDDMLNVNLYAYGKNMIDVIGKFDYDGSEMRKLCIRTRGHNSGIVDGKSQFSRGVYTPWSPEKVNIKSDLEVNISESTVVAYGRFDRGYEDGLTTVIHERKVVFFREGLGGSKPFFVLLDDFTASDDAAHKCEINFILQPRPLTLRGRHATLDAGDGVTLEIVTHAALSTVTGADAPEYMGYRPNRDNRLAKEHIPTPFLTVHGYGTEVHLATVLYPTPDGHAPEIAVTCDADSFTVTLDGKEYNFQRDAAFPTTEKV